MLEESKPANPCIDTKETDNNAKLYLIAVSALILFSQPLAILQHNLFYPLALILTMATLAVAAHSKVPLKQLRISFAVVLFVFLAMLSVAYSISKRSTLSELVLLLCVVVTAIVIGNNLSLNRICDAIAWAGISILGISVVVALAFPSYGLQNGDYQAGSIRGIYSHRNQLAFTLVIPLVALAGMWTTKRRTKVVLAGFLLCGILSTNSSTALVCSILTIVLFLILRFLTAFQSGYKLVPVILTLPLVSLCAVAIYQNWEKVLLLLGRDATFTGRSFIWAAVGQVSSSEPLFGFGWGAVWGGSWVQKYASALTGFNIPHAHNGYLDIRIQIGYVGLVVIILILLAVLIRGFALLLRTGHKPYIVPPVCIIIYAVYNIFETRITLPFSLLILVILSSQLLVAKDELQGGPKSHV
jgi:exopolysaccharide production protein ExoQ